MIRELAGAVMFLTRLPVPGVDPQIPLHRLSAWFPAAGLLVGGLVALVYGGATLVGLPPAAAVWAAIAAEMVITGALHPDGLADTADGLAGRTLERRLEIMKDPRLGSYGGIALLLTLGGRGVLLTALPQSVAIPAIIALHAACRWAPVWALARYPYVGVQGGIGGAFTGGGGRELMIAGLTVAGAAWLFTGAAGLLAAGVAVLSGVAATAYLARQLGGITGDVCGAVTEVSLLGGLLVMAGAAP